MYQLWVRARGAEDGAELDAETYEGESTYDRMVSMVRAEFWGATRFQGLGSKLISFPSLAGQLPSSQNSL